MLRWVRCAVLLIIPACFHPVYDHPACGPHGECPIGFTCSAALVCENGSSATPGDASASDGSDTTMDCWAHWMDGSVAIDASTVKEITELSSAGHERAPWISSDELRMYFARDPMSTGDGDVYFASRSSPTGRFGAAIPVANLNSLANEVRAWLTSDELTIALSTTRDGTLDILMTTHAAGQPFATPDNAHLAMVNAKGSLRLDLFLTNDLLRLYFSADTGPGGKLQLWIAARSTAGDDFGTPSLVPGINGGILNVSGPALYQDERLVLFGSYPTNMTEDLYYTTRSTATDSFGMLAKVPTVNGAASELDPVLSADGCELYFSSNRDPDGKYHLFQARVTR